MKKLLIIFLFLFIASLQAEVNEYKSDVYFANGINTSEDDAEKALIALRKKINPSLVPNVPVGNAYSSKKVKHGQKQI